jgi:LuxR family maltose regulon positive regulatory protein
MRHDFTFTGSENQRALAPMEDRSGEDASSRPLLSSKLTVPNLPVELVERPRLAEFLDAGTRGPVTSLIAPAGWGKTVLLNSWVRKSVPAGPVAWLTLERGDDGTRFWSYLHAALSAAAPPEHENRPALPAPGTVEHDVHLAQLANALAQRRNPILLVLDEFHLVDDPDVAKGLDFLLRHAATQFRLVIAARCDPALPLHRWRLSGELTELRPDQLAFTAAETNQLLARHGVVLPDADLDALRERVEGWPAGLRLAALAMRRHPDPTRFVEEFSGEHESVAEYLTGEVLAGRPPETLDTLRSISVLDRFCGNLVDALTGRMDGERILAELERTNAFVVSLGGRRSWYRFHRLLGELLRAELRRLAPEKVAGLHHRAACWYAAEGSPVDALRNALAGQDWAHATSLLNKHWYDLVLCGHRDAQRTVLAPPPDDAVRAEPELALAFAADSLGRRDLSGSDAYLRLADAHGHLLVGARRDRFALMAVALRVAGAQLGGETTKVLSLARQMLALVGEQPRDDEEERRRDDGARAIGYTALGIALLDVGDVDPAEDALNSGLANAEGAGLPCPRLVCTSRLALVRAVRGELRSADRTARLALGMPLCNALGRMVHVAHAYLAMAIVNYDWDRLDDAGRYLELAARSNEPESELALTLAITIVRAWLLQARGDLMGSYEVLRAGRRDLGERTWPRHLAHLFTATEADLWTSCGDADTAREMVLPLVDDAQGGSDSLAVALARAHLRDDDPAAAVKTLPPWTDADGSTAFLGLRLDAALVAALAAHRVGDDRRASQIFEQALQLAEPEGFRRAFTRGGAQVRALLVEHLDSGTAYWSTVNELIEGAEQQPAAGDRPPPVLTDPLTDRELTILRYLQGMLSNLEIASELFLSVNTVKTHVRHIYRKLDAAHRREAVQRARELHLL